ncbi:unnamed protein product [Meloidogyne enterolobii]|uniref:Uncharacterized protein n=1 Tax=Meloidogyne enterolobii TaxID=390850 RepID=A0ACB0ZUD0_MELEN
MGGVNSKSCERDVVDSNDPTEWKEQQQGEHQQQQHSFDDPSASQHQLSPNQIEPSFDEYSNDPFLLQEFTNANSLGGIVCVENSLHQNSSAESTPGGIRQFGQQRPLNPYSKFFNEFSSAFLGGNAKSSIMRRSNGLDTSLDRKQINNEGYNQQQQQLQQNELNNPSSSNEQLLQSNNGSCSSNNSSISPYGNNNGRDLTTKINNSNNNGGVGGRASGRVMREIIV